MKALDVYCNYGVLAAEKRNIYTYGSEHPHAVCSDEITVFIPDEWELYTGPAGDLMVQAPWGWRYGINDVLSDLNGYAVFKAFDSNGHPATAYLYTAEQLENKMTKKEGRKNEL